MNLVFFCAININRTMIPSRAGSLSIFYAPSLYNGTRRTVKPEGLEGAAPGSIIAGLGLDRGAEEGEEGEKEAEEGGEEGKSAMRRNVALLFVRYAQRDRGLTPKLRNRHPVLRHFVYSPANQDVGK